MRRLKVLNPKSLAAIRKGGSNGRKGAAATSSSGSSSSASSTSSMSSSSLSSGDFSSSLDGYASAAAAAPSSSPAETAGSGGGEEEDGGEASAPPALDLGFLLDEIMSPSGAAPLRWDAVVSSDVPLKVIASCVDSLSPVVLGDFEDASDLAGCLRASANVPEVAGEPVVHRGRRLVDAAVFEPVPTQRGRWDTFYPAFARAVRGEGPVPVDPREAIAVLDILDAMALGAREHQVVTL